MEKPTKATSFIKQSDYSHETDTRPMSYHQKIAAPSSAPKSVVGVNPAFIRNTMTTLVMDENWSVAGDDFDIIDTKGVPIVSCKGRYFSMRRRKVFTTPRGEELFTLHRQLFSIPPCFYLQRPSGEQVLHIRGRWTFGRAKLDAEFKNVLGNGRVVVFEVRGNFLARAANVTWDGRTVARVRRVPWTGRLAFGGQTYTVEVEPGVDVALIAAIVVALDEDTTKPK